MSALENQIKNGVIEKVESIENRLERLERILGQFPDYLKDDAKIVVEQLKQAFFALYYNNNKQQALMQIINNYTMDDQTICIVVPKAYYLQFFIRRQFNKANIEITTANNSNYQKRNFCIYRCEFDLFYHEKQINSVLI